MVNSHYWFLAVYIFKLLKNGVPRMRTTKQMGGVLGEYSFQKVEENFFSFPYGLSYGIMEGN